jgi:hypothetical protein
MAEVSRKMNSKILSLSMVTLLGCTALLYALSSTAFAGQGCGTNWMGDTSGDTDFSVSKNQNTALSNQAASSSAATKPGVSLGSTASKAAIQGLEPDKTSPQSPGSAITWTATVTYSGDLQLLYDFLLKGPSTGGQQKDMTGWTAKNTWTWNITDSDIGESQVEVRAMRAGTDGYDDSRTASYKISVSGQNASSDASEGGDAHPQSKTSDSISSKPRVAPDEIKSTTAESSGPNMQMPDPSPKSQTTDKTQTATTTTTAGASTQSEDEKIMEVDGRWTVKLDGAGSSMDLVLIQTGGSVTGMGSLSDQNTKIPIIATGEVTADTLSLNVKTVVGDYVNKIDKRFDLDLVKVDKIISGSYQAYSGAENEGKGNATASRFAA